MTPPAAVGHGSDAPPPLANQALPRYILWPAGRVRQHDRRQAGPPARPERRLRAAL